MIDTKAVTGESVPRKAVAGDHIYSGRINLSGVLEAKVTKEYSDSTVSKIMEMVEEAQNKKSDSETFVSKFSRIYTPVMFVFALLVMIYPPLTFSYGNWDTWIYRGLIFDCGLSKWTCHFYSDCISWRSCFCGETGDRY